MQQGKDFALAFLERQAKTAPSQEARERFEKLAAEMRAKLKQRK